MLVSFTLASHAHGLHRARRHGGSARIRPVEPRDRLSGEPGAGLARRPHRPYQSTWLFNSFVADPLVILDPDGKYQPALATSWESSPDGKVWTFKLRSGVTFQDGTPFDAAAVKYNLERINDPKTASAQLKSDVGPWKTVEVVDPLTLRITYDTPWVTLLDALRRTPIWSPTAAEKHGLANFSKNLVGAGPFTLEQWAPNDRIVFKKWPATAAGTRCRRRRARWRSTSSPSASSARVRCWLGREDR